MIELISIYRVKGAVETLYDLMKEREPYQSISHKEMPTMMKHAEFVHSKPYEAWYLIKKTDKEISDGVWLGDYVGSVYLTKQREIGIFIFKEFQEKGYASEAVSQLMTHWPGEFFAHINPNNEASIKFFENLGAKHIQNTYSL